jgi:hypothetical protein
MYENDALTRRKNVLQKSESTEKWFFFLLLKHICVATDNDCTVLVVLLL